MQYVVKAGVVAWARQHEVRSYLTATNASWMNRIESQSAGLEEFAPNDSDYRTHEALREAIESYMKWRNGERPITESRIDNATNLDRK